METDLKIGIILFTKGFNGIYTINGSDCTAFTSASQIPSDVVLISNLNKPIPQLPLIKTKLFLRISINALMYRYGLEVNRELLWSC